VLAGLAGGLVGGWMMSQFTHFWKSLPRSQNSLPYSRQEWDAVSRSAEVIGERFSGGKLRVRQQKLGAALVHYFVAGSSGALYAVFVARRGTTISKWAGPLFGLAMWVVGNEIALPALDLTRKPTDYTFGERANALGEHIIYGLTTDRLYRTLATNI
jgi:Protein of unknown function (DUF1440)